MKLYKRVEWMTWRELGETPGSICGDHENLPDGSGVYEFDLDAERRVTHCECALVPAPQAERHAELGRAVEKVLAEHGASQWAIEDEAEHGDWIVAIQVWGAIAAWMEAENE